MPCFVDGKKGYHGEAFHVFSEQLCDSYDIFLLHFSQPREYCGGGWFVHANHAGKSHIARYETEVGVDQFWDVQKTVIVPADSNRCGNNDSCGVYGLEDPLEVTLSGYFFDKYGRQSFRS